MEPAVEMDAYVLQGVADAANDEVAPKSPRQTDSSASACLIIDIVQALEVPLAMIQVDPQRQLSTKKPRLDKRCQIILPFGADLNTQAEFLTASGKGWGME